MLVACVFCAHVTIALAQEAVPGVDEPLFQDDSEFGPLILIERIDVSGNTATQTELILRTLPLKPGDVIHASDKRLRQARFKVLALGFFRDVTLGMRKGTARGQVIIDMVKAAASRLPRAA